MKTALIAILALVLGAGPAAAAPSRPVPAPAGMTATEVSFRGGGGLTLHGTVLKPAGSSTTRPGVVLVTGSGAGGPRGGLLLEGGGVPRAGAAPPFFAKK